VGLFSLDIVIPIIPVHHKYLPRLLRNIESSSVLPNNVIIAASSQTRSSIELLKSITEDSHLRIKIIGSENLHTAGANRNRGWEFCESEYISFCDADDSYSKKRIEVLRNIADKFSPDLILHNHSKLKPQFYIDHLRTSDVFLTEKVLYHSTFPNKSRDKSLETGVAGDTNICLPDGSKKSWKITHGHATMKRSVTERYGGMPFGEDGQMCRDILFNGKRVVYTPNKLSNYNRITFLNVAIKSFLKIESDMAGIKRSFFSKE
jgi:glycosyltransferase involved in cell wall biosynthesis